MSTIFLVCLAIGGTLLVCQFVMTIVGLGGEALHLDVSHDFGHGSADDAGSDFGTADHDFSAGDSAHGDDLHGGASDVHQDSTQLFSVLSYRTVVAFLAFFGLGGLLAESLEARPMVVGASALGAGGAAMYGIYWLMRGLYSLRCEGTLQIQRAIGKQATVYIPIPGQQAGAGKVQVPVQGRLVEYLAVTAGNPLATGTKVTVVGVMTQNTLQVEPVMQIQRSVQ